MSSSEKIILIDADVVSHFITAGEILYLPKIFPYKIYILDKVMKELERFPKRKVDVDNLINLKLLFPMDFPEKEHEVVKEYLWIRKMMFYGDGESACLAVAKHHKNILASNNLRDIKPYCERHGIVYLTTMHFLCYAMQNGIFDEERCDKFIHTVKTETGKLPFWKMAEYTCPTEWKFA
jgi:predicted nucleic acid-binding protein